MSRSLLWCLARNIPLAHFDQEGDDGTREAVGFFSAKELPKTARRLVGGLAQYKVAEQMAREWGGYSSLLRRAITDLCNSNNHSGNVRKGILRLNECLNGRVLRRGGIEEERVLIEREGRTLTATRRVRGRAIIGAERAFAGFALPKDYPAWSPAKKKAFRAQQARERRSG